MKKIVSPGEKVDVSGQYKIKGPRGGISSNEITLIKGKTTPPTPKPNQKMILVDKTKHKKQS